MLEGLAEEASSVASLQAHFVWPRLQAFEACIQTVACHVHRVVLEVQLAVSDKDDDDVEILVLALDETLDVLGLVIWTQYEDEPLHRSLDHLASNLVHLVLLDVGQVLDRPLDGFGCLNLHLTISMLHAPASNAVGLCVLLIECDQVVRDVLQVLILDDGVHLFGLEDDGVAHEVRRALGVEALLVGVMHVVAVRCLVMNEAVDKNLEAEVVICFQRIEDLLRQVHG